eukprot:TRINITY_DN85448_c0_g1_i6.p1 TRINITY_DN85448_c0_g1~~TRINITY_DN85448_c0_g1_i6.p1  ORF type:complete len:364 (+),score=-23.11 TRINITY_DN85448_c0_g1_i6:335-1426(+)
MWEPTSIKPTNQATPANNLCTIPLKSISSATMNNSKVCQKYANPDTRVPRKCNILSSFEMFSPKQQLVYLFCYQIHYNYYKQEISKYVGPDTPIPRKCNILSFFIDVHPKIATNVSSFITKYIVIIIRNKFQSTRILILMYLKNVTFQVCLRCSPKQQLMYLFNLFLIIQRIINNLVILQFFQLLDKLQSLQERNFNQPLIYCFCTLTNYVNGTIEKILCIIHLPNNNNKNNSNNNYNNTTQRLQRGESYKTLKKVGNKYYRSRRTTNALLSIYIFINIKFNQARKNHFKGFPNFSSFLTVRKEEILKIQNIYIYIQEIVKLIIYKRPYAIAKYIFQIHPSLLTFINICQEKLGYIQTSEQNP